MVVMIVMTMIIIIITIVILIIIIQHADDLNVMSIACDTLDPSAIALGIVIITLVAYLERAWGWWARRIRPLGYYMRWRLRPSTDMAGSPVVSLPRCHCPSSDIGSSDRSDTRPSHNRRCCPLSCTSGNELYGMDADDSMRITQYATPQSTYYTRWCIHIPELQVTCVENHNGF